MLRRKQSVPDKMIVGRCGLMTADAMERMIWTYVFVKLLASTAEKRSR